MFSESGTEPTRGGTKATAGGKVTTEGGKKAIGEMLEGHAKMLKGGGSGAEPKKTKGTNKKGTKSKKGPSTGYQAVSRTHKYFPLLQNKKGKNKTHQYP